MANNDLRARDGGMEGPLSMERRYLRLYLDDSTSRSTWSGRHSVGAPAPPPRRPRGARRPGGRRTRGLTLRTTEGTAEAMHGAFDGIPDGAGAGSHRHGGRPPPPPHPRALPRATRRRLGSTVFLPQLCLRRWRKGWGQGHERTGRQCWGGAQADVCFAF